MEKQVIITYARLISKEKHCRPEILVSSSHLWPAGYSHNPANIKCTFDADGILIDIELIK